eukprot:GHVP01039722.1.p1 GENE.GHVP01039722.1~~GHVP01039722.1.p1  ORF type:complete len:278 (-),score=64.39 GHVP01039722.1:47-880(-)
MNFNNFISSTNVDVDFWAFRGQKYFTKKISLYEQIPQDPLFAKEVEIAWNHFNEVRLGTKTPESFRDYWAGTDISLIGEKFWLKYLDKIAFLASPDLPASPVLPETPANTPLSNSVKARSPKKIPRVSPLAKTMRKLKSLKTLSPVSPRPTEKSKSPIPPASKKKGEAVGPKVGAGKTSEKNPIGQKTVTDKKGPLMKKPNEKKTTIPQKAIAEKNAPAPPLAPQKAIAEKKAPAPPLAPQKAIAEKNASVSSPVSQKAIKKKSSSTTEKAATQKKR